MHVISDGINLGLKIAVDEVEERKEKRAKTSTDEADLCPSPEPSSESSKEPDDSKPNSTSRSENL